MKRAPVSQLASFWLALVALACFVVQIVPVLPYVILASLLPLAGLLMQAALVTVFVESLLGRVPRYVAMIPALLYGAYFATVFYERAIVLPALASQISASNIASVPFNPASQSLRFGGSFNAQLLLVRYDIPRVLWSNSSAIALAAPERCPKDVNLQNAIQRGPLIVVGDGERVYCVEKVDFAAPASGILSITKQPGENLRSPVHHYIEAITFELDGQMIGEFKTVRANVLKLFPDFGVGCGLLDMPAAWQCGVHLGHEDVAVTAIPDARDDTLPYRARHDPQVTYIAGILELTKRSDAKLQVMAMATAN